MSIHAQNKKLVAEFLTGMADGEPEDTASVMARHCHDDCHWEVFHPFNTLLGNDAALRQFWQPLREAWPDYENRVALIIGGEYEGRQQVSTWGHLMGTFDVPLVGIPPTHGVVTMRFGFNCIVRDGKISKAYVLLDLVDLMRQAGHYPFRPMPGSAEQWAFPPCDTGATAFDHDPVMGAESLRIIREMQVGLVPQAEIKNMANLPDRHSPHWHKNMNWYGPAGVGSMRGRRGFRNFHGALFLQAFSDRTGWVRDHEGPEDAPGHYVRMGDGRYAVTGGWPSLNATHLGPEWLGLPPTGRRVMMRVADWYRLDNANKIIDNWVMIDVPHMVHQMGMDIFHDLQFFVDRSQPRTAVFDPV
jgi:predicted ester cyclase